ncbi:MAG: hypothetical protein KOO65_08795 [Desulfobacterales bacterium]|nr:hypothetical protein [Desulfobacterales bacterium]
MPHTKSVYKKRSSVDRRSPGNRRILNIGPGYPEVENRQNFKERRRGWEDRFGWERISKWSSSPIYSDLS